MYLQITTRCNLACEHCCFSCTEDGHDMPLAIVEKAIRLAAQNGDDIAIGGGEPTLHDDFEKILCLAISCNTSELTPFVATNGTLFNRAILISKLAEHGAIHGGVSLDEWHCNTDDLSLKKLFSNSGRVDDQRFIRAISNPISSGRGSQILSANDGCCCSDFLVQPDGNIRFCGCIDSPNVGNVNSGISSVWFEKTDDSNLKERCYKHL